MPRLSRGRWVRVILRSALFDPPLSVGASRALNPPLTRNHFILGLRKTTRRQDEVSSTGCGDGTLNIIMTSEKRCRASPSPRRVRRQKPGCRRETTGCRAIDPLRVLQRITIEYRNGVIEENL